MRRIISTSEILGSFRRGADEVEVCAVGEANFDDEKSRLIMSLESFLRPVGPGVKEQPADWLPKRQMLEESMAPGEAAGLARDIFHRWAGKVRQSIPFTIHN